MEDRKKNVLVILPIERDIKAISLMKEENEFNIFLLEDLNFEYDSICEKFNVEKYVNKAIKFVIDNKIDGLLYSHDFASLVAGHVCEQTGLPGPSLDAMFISCHKYYSRRSEVSPIKSEAFDIYNNDISNINFPCYVKSPFLMCSHLHYVVKSKREMADVLEIFREELYKWGKMFFDFFELYVCKEKFPLACKSIVLIEELVTDYKQVAIEGWVDDKGDVNIWGISDINYHKINSSQNCYTMPTVIRPEVQSQIIDLTTQTVLKHKIKYSFFNVDMWHWNGAKKPKIIEVNGRAASLYYLIHYHCFNRLLYKAMLYLSIGDAGACYKESLSTNNQQNKFGALFFIVTYNKGNVDQIVNFNEAQRYKESNNVCGLELFIKPGTEISDNGTAGFRVGKFYLFGDSINTLNKFADEIRHAILFDIENTPYICEDIKSTSELI